MSRNFELLNKAERNGRLLMGPAAGGEFAPAAAQPRSAIRRPGFADAVSVEVAALAHRLFFDPVTGRRAVAFTAVDSHAPGTVAVQVAAALCAVARGSVCLLDAKVDAPTLHDTFAIRNDQGLTTAVERSAPIASFGVRIGDSDLTVIPAGPPSGTWRNGYSITVLQHLLRQLPNEFDFLIVDAPAAPLDSTLVTLGRECDGLVVTIDAHRTHRREALRFVQEIEAADITLLGAVLDKHTAPSRY